MIGDSYSASKRPMCIASVRVEALRASGLRAAAAQRISSLYEEEHNADVVRKKHSECLQGTGISYSSNASSSSSLPSYIPAPSLQASFHPSMEKCFIAHSDPHYSMKSPSSCSMHDGLSSCDGRVYKRRKTGENVMGKRIHAAYISRKAFDETSTDANHSSLLSSPMKMIHSDAISVARVLNQVSGQETQITKGMKHSLDVNDRRLSLVFGQKALGKYNCVYQAPEQANLPEEFGKYIEQQGSTFSYSNADDERVHTGFPFSLVVNDRRSSLILGEKAFCKYNHVYKIPQKTKPQEDNTRFPSSLGVNGRRSPSILSEKNFRKDDSVYETPKQTKLPAELGKCIHQQISTHNYVNPKENNVQSLCPSSLDVNHGRSSLVHGKRVSSKDYRIPQKTTQPEKQGIQQQVPTYGHTKVKENSVHSITPASLDVNDRKSSTVLGKRISCKDDSVYKTPGQTKPHEVSGKRIQRQASTHSYSKKKGYSFHSRVPIKDAKYNRELKQCNTTVADKDDTGLCSQIALEAIEMMMHSMEMKTNNIHLVEEEDIGPNTQIALEAIDLMIDDTVVRTKKIPVVEKEDISFRKQMTVEKKTLMTHGSNTKLDEHMSVEASTQIALDAMDTIGHADINCDHRVQQDTTNSCGEDMDIGANTQIALEAMDLMMSNTTMNETSSVTCNSHAANGHEVDMEIGVNTQIALEAMDLLISHNTMPETTNVTGNLQAENFHGEDLDISANTQIALEAMDLMKGHTTMSGTVSVKGKAHAANTYGEVVGTGAETQMALEGMDPMICHAMTSEIASVKGNSPNGNSHGEVIGLMIGHTTKNGAAGVAGNSNAENLFGEDVDIGADTQIALEAMDLMISHTTKNDAASVTGNSNAENLSGEDVDIGADTQIALEAMDLMISHTTKNEAASATGNSNAENLFGEDVEIGADTQIALEAMDLMISHTTKNEAASVTGNSNAENLFGEDVDIGADTQIALEAMDLMISHTTKNEAASVRGNTNADNLFGEDVDIGADTQIALEAMDLMISHTTKNKAAGVTGSTNAENLFGEDVDIGADTQIALEAMDLMISHTTKNEAASVTGNSNAENLFGEDVDIGVDTQIALEAMDLMISHTTKNEAVSVTGNSNGENLFGENVDIGADTQIALETMDLMISHTTKNEAASVTGNTNAENLFREDVDIGADSQYTLEGMDPMVGNTMMNDDSNHNLGRVEVLPSNAATSTQSAFEAINTMGDGNRKNPSYMETEKEKQKSRWVGPRKVKQKSLNKDMNNIRDVISREKKPPVSKGERKALGQHMAINSKMSSDLDTVEESCASKSSTFVSADKGKTAEAVLPKTREDFSSRKDSPFRFLTSAIPRRKRSQRRSLVISSNRNTSVIQQDRENKICKPGFGKRIHPQKLDDKKQKLSILAGPNGVLSEKTKEIGTLETITDNARRKTRKREPICIRVLFSHGLANDIVRHQKKILTRLGGQTANEAADSTHFISDAFVRTKNMLESIASGKNIVTTLWLEACNLAHYFVDEKNYILRDLKKEKELGFCLHSSLAASRQKPLLEGMSFIVSPNTVPDFEGMSAIIKSAGGQIMKNVRKGTKESKSTSIVIASKEDFEFCVSFLKKGTRVYSTEFILHGIIVQSLDFSRNHLFNEHY